MDNSPPDTFVFQALQQRCLAALTEATNWHAEALRQAARVAELEKENAAKRSLIEELKNSAEEPAA